MDGQIAQPNHAFQPPVFSTAFEAYTHHHTVRSHVEDQHHFQGSNYNQG